MTEEEKAELMRRVFDALMADEECVAMIVKRADLLILRDALSKEVDGTSRHDSLLRGVNGLLEVV